LNAQPGEQFGTSLMYPFSFTHYYYECTRHVSGIRRSTSICCSFRTTRVFRYQRYASRLGLALSCRLGLSNTG
jgi:hypothetical protein